MSLSITDKIALLEYYEKISSGHRNGCVPIPVKNAREK